MYWAHARPPGAAIAAQRRAQMEVMRVLEDAARRTEVVAEPVAVDELLRDSRAYEGGPAACTVVPYHSEQVSAPEVGAPPPPPPPTHKEDWTRGLSRVEP